MRVFGIICLLAAGVFAQATGSVTGRVTWTQNTIERSRVLLTSTKSRKVTFEQLTDERGGFRFERIPAGRYEISAGARCVSTVAICGNYSARGEVEVSANSDTEVNLALVYIPMRIEEVVVIATGEEQALSNTSKTVNLIDGQEMRDRADFTLVDTLRTIPGFRVQQLGGFGRTASIKSRGLRNQDTAVLLDGIRFRDPGSITGDATPFLSDITLTSVSRVEVLRGSGSSLYGTNAVGGTIDFRTPETMQEGFHGQVSGALGGLGLGRFRSNVSYGTDKVGISGAFSRTAYTKGVDGNDNASNNNFQSRVEVNPDEFTNISARFFFSDAKVRLNVSPDTLGTLPPSNATIINAEEGINFVPDADDPDSIQKSHFFSGQFALTHVVNEQLTIEGYYQGLETKRENQDGVLGPGFQSEFTSIFGGTIHTANVHATWTPSAPHTFTGGYEFEAEGFRNEGGSPGTSFWTRAHQHSNTLYAQHLIALLDGDLQFAGGARAQWFDLGVPRFSQTDGPYANRTFSSPPSAYTFDGAASYRIRKTGTTFRTHVGNGYRAPSMYERFGTFFFFNNFFPQGNPALKPERSLGADAAVEQEFFDRKLKATATWFYTKVKDEITYLPTDDFGAPVYYNFDRHYSRGGEFSIDAKPTSSTRIFGSYTYTNSDIRNFSRPSIATLASADREAFGIPGHQFTLVATQWIKRNFWVTFDLLLTSSYLAPVFSNTDFRQYTYRFDGNRRGDLTAGYNFQLRNRRYNVRLFGTVENLFDDEYFENGFRTAGLNGRFGVSFGF